MKCAHGLNNHTSNIFRRRSIATKVLGAKMIDINMGCPVKKIVNGHAGSALMKDEKLAVKARELGQLFREEMQKLVTKYDLLKLVRGKGLLNAVVINDTEDSSTAWDICMKMRDNGLLAKPTHGNIIRFAPPLVMTKDQLMECVAIIDKTLAEF
jgi:ornithine--oxo-acid transaminase